MGWMPEHLTREQMEQRGRTGARLLKAGRLSQAEIARRVGVSRTTVSAWSKQLAGGGLRALRRRRASGRPARLNPADKQTLVETLKLGALAAGFPTERLTDSRRGAFRLRGA